MSNQRGCPQCSRDLLCSPVQAGHLPFHPSMDQPSSPGCGVCGPQNLIRQSGIMLPSQCPLLSLGTPEMPWATEPSKCHWYDVPLNLCRFIFYPPEHRRLPRASKILATSCLSVLMNTMSSTSSTHVMICGTHGSPRPLQTVLRRRAARFAHTSAGLWICPLFYVTGILTLLVPLSDGDGKGCNCHVGDCKARSWVSVDLQSKDPVFRSSNCS